MEKDDPRVNRATRYTHALVQRCLAIVLALVFGWLLCPPALIHPAESTLPACCRKAGKHRCMQSHATDAGGAIYARCTQYPGVALAYHLAGFAPATHQAIFAGLLNHPTLRPQVEAGYRASHLRSKQKRGPPSFVIS